MVQEKQEKIAYFSIILLIIVLGLVFFIHKKSTVDNFVTSGSPNIDIEQSTKITFMDVGQGDAIFVEFSNGEQMLVDCAIDAIVIEALGRTMDFYDKTIDYLVVTHPDSDHYGGCIDVLKRFNIKNILYNGEQKPQSQLWQSFMSAIADEEKDGAIFKNISQQFELDIGLAQVKFLYPDYDLRDSDSDSNNNSVVIQFTQGTQDVLLTGDVEYESEAYLVHVYGDELQSEILKIGHHGSLSSTSPVFLDAVRPSEAIVSSGAGNKFGHPSQRVIKRVERVGARVWRTDIEHDIIVALSNTSYSIKSRK